MLHSIIALDQQLFYLINSCKSPLLDFLMVKISDFGLFAPFIAIFIGYRLIKGNNRERLMWIMGIITIIISDALCARVLKPLVGRPRPYLVLDHVHLFKGGKWILTDPDLRSRLGMNLSWPSCHATNMWSATFYLGHFRPLWGLVLAFFAFWVSYSRVYLGVHYPLDCLGGMIVGGCLGSLAAVIVKRFDYHL